MWKSSVSEMPNSVRSNTIQPLASSPADTPGTPASLTLPAQLNQYSTIGKSIAVRGEIAGSESVYIYGCVEGLINLPAHRVTIGGEGEVNADISAREVVIMGNVCGNLNGGDRVEIHSGGSLTGDLAAHRICIEDGAIVKGAIEVLQSSEIDETETQEEPHSES